MVKIEMTDERFAELEKSLPELSQKLTQLLGEDISMKIEAQIDRNDVFTGVKLESEMMTPKSGMLAFLVKEFQLDDFGGSRAYRLEGKPESAVVLLYELHMSYSHHDGGGNGHTLAFPWDSGRIIFTYIFTDGLNEGHWTTQRIR